MQACQPCRERLRLAWAYFEQRDLARADAELQTSHDIEPLLLGARSFAFSIFWDRGVQLRDRQARRAQFERVIAAFEDLIEMQEDATDIGGLHYWAGRFCGELLRYDEAIAHLEIAMFVGSRPLGARLYLGWFHLERQAFTEAGRILRAMLASAQRQLRQRPIGPARDRVDAISDPEALNEILTQGYLLLARVYAERGGDARQAEQAADRARRHVGHVSPFFRHDAEAFYQDTIGWVRHLAGHNEDALIAAEAAVKSSGDPEHHYHLAEIALALATRRTAERALWLRRAEESSAQALAGDLRGVLSERLAGLRRRISDLAGHPPGAATAAGVQRPPAA